MAFEHSYKISKKYKTSVAYFSMEFAINQALKIYSGGLGFLAGSHMRSAFEIKQNMVGIGMLWKYGYYHQVWSSNNDMDTLYREKHYNFLRELDIVLEVYVNRHPVKVKVFYLPSEVFGTAPMFLLSTDHAENDHLAQTITHKLYDSNLTTRIAQYIVLGIGGAKLLDALGHQVEIYHLNEAHGLPAAFYIHEKEGSLQAVKDKMVFTTHTPVEAGNEKNDPDLLYKMGYFNNLETEEVEKIVGLDNGRFNHTLAALRLAKKANAVSQKHKEVARKMWSRYEDITKIEGITNAQNRAYWTDPQLKRSLDKGNKKPYQARKAELKKQLFKEVADQTGKIFDPETLTIVWARRFAEYKRPDLIARDLERFANLLNNEKYPVQFIWAGKPYPEDHGAVNMFNKLVHLTYPLKNATVLTGYELKLSALLKKGSDVWLNNPRIPLEASGTSGMTAAMNGSINFSTYDGWVIEFEKDEKNSFIIPPVDQTLTIEEQDMEDLIHMYNVLEQKIIPLYYDDKEKWLDVVINGYKDVNKFFNSQRMADEYYTKMYI